MELSKKVSFGAILGFVLILFTAHISGGAGKAIDWNDESISWQDYNAGLEAGRSSNKPVLLLFYADW